MEGSAEKWRFRELFWFYLALIGSAFFGLFLIYLSTQLPWELVKECVRDIGIAFVTAAILGVTIHIWLETNVVRDVFRAAVGHILPPELRDEVHWISSFKCLIYECRCTIDIEDIGDGVVKITEEIETEMRNITSKNQKIKRWFTKDDWGIPGKMADIQYYEYVIGSGTPVVFHGTPERQRMTVEIHMDDANLRPSETIRTFCRGVEFKRLHDFFQEEFIYPVVRPEIRIRSCPDSLEYFPAFAHDPPVSIIQEGRTYILQGTLMPHQRMGVRWLPKTDTTAPSGNT
jgi:hypothetical protein